MPLFRRPPPPPFLLLALQPRKSGAEENQKHQHRAANKITGIQLYPSKTCFWLLPPPPSLSRTILLLSHSDSEEIPSAEGEERRKPIVFLLLLFLFSFVSRVTHTQERRVGVGRDREEKGEEKPTRPCCSPPRYSDQIISIIIVLGRRRIRKSPEWEIWGKSCVRERDIFVQKRKKGLFLIRRHFYVFRPFFLCVIDH